MELKVIKKFNGKAEGKTLCPGDTIVTDDVERINALVGRGFCVIVALDNPTADTPNDENPDAPKDGEQPATSKKGKAGAKNDKE